MELSKPLTSNCVTARDEPLVAYATYGMSSQLFVQKYQLYLRDREALRQELEETLPEEGQ
jgi:hypothetical protein